MGEAEGVGLFAWDSLKGLPGLIGRNSIFGLPAHLEETYTALQNPALAIEQRRQAIISAYQSASSSIQSEWNSGPIRQGRVRGYAGAFALSFLYGGGEERFGIAVDQVVGEASIVEPYTATLGQANTTDYRATFFEENPELEGRVVVHHAVEQQVLSKFPDVVTEEEIHSLENLRGIPNGLNSDLHLSQIRVEWNRFYRPFIEAGTSPTKAQLLQKATEIDAKFGFRFTPPVGDQ